MDGRLVSEWLQIRAMGQLETSPTSTVWRHVEVILPARLSVREALDRIEAQIRINATDAGEFVQQFRVGAKEPYSEGSCKWSAAYLPGPPGPFPAGGISRH